ncbi:hypothetical protein CKC_02805 [Candidatus Liberibacter solanacearum CLso-ZC1]|uniref:Uncharacterized protein n=1 Tax=Liberibacter solanacearum (strain CLso-ZC1) TaxID=658172 RepID=E4UD70_LIBSC|nr:hypothetical protein CKC_02805 [Candidatus Liberibacter solanacearum CLso-ZC1]
MLFLGLRRSDVMRVGKQHIKDGFFPSKLKRQEHMLLYQ